MSNELVITKLILTIGPDRNTQTHIAYFFFPRPTDGRCAPDPSYAAMIEASTIPNKHVIDVRTGITFSERMFELLQKEGISSGHLLFHDADDFSSGEVRMIEEVMGQLKSFTYEYFDRSSVASKLDLRRAASIM